MKKSDIVMQILHPLSQTRGELIYQPQREQGLAFAPTNIALCKYWGKRDNELNLPMTGSLSVALPDKGAMTSLSLNHRAQDQVVLNGKELASDTPFVMRLGQYLDLFRPKKPWYLQININMNIPVSAGLASSACGFAALISAMNELFDWQLSKHDLSILARLGSGSATRSFWQGFVEWRAGIQADGMDSYAEPLSDEWPDLLIGLLTITENEKPISSRVAMQRTMDSSILYGNWPKKVARDMVVLRQAIHLKNFSLLAGTAESNALTMHATMLSSWPPICYSLPGTLAAMHKIWELRRDGLELYFTQDAGPNLKLLFSQKDKNTVTAQFPQLEVVQLFE